MAAGRWATTLRILKPIAAGLALAYLVTAFVDKPAPVHFQPENPYASKQAEIVEPQAAMVTEKNIMKLGSPLSVQPDAVVAPQPKDEEVPLTVGDIVEEAILSANATASKTAGNGTQEP